MSILFLFLKPFSFNSDFKLVLFNSLITIVVLKMVLEHGF